MGIPNLTVQVLNLSPGMILDDLILFFSYCGTVEDIELEISLNEDKPRSALVTFKQPYAFQTAFLLNGANFADRPIQVLPLKFYSYPSHIDKLTNLRQTEVSVSPSISTEKANFEPLGARNCYDKALSERGRDELIHRKGYNVVAAKQAEGDKAARITNGEYVSSGTAWFSAMFGKASKSISELSTSRKRNNPNSRKQK